MSDDKILTLEDISTDIDFTHIYVQPGGCVEIGQQWPGPGEEYEMVHMCNWDVIAAEVERIREVHRANGSHGFS